MENYHQLLTPEDCTFCLIDHQTGTMLGVQDIRLDQFKSNILGLAKTAVLHKIPTVITASFVSGPNGPIMPEILELFPELKINERPGYISAWDDPEFREMVEATGRKRLVMAGVTSDVCLYFPAIQARAAGYDVWCVYDASGCWDMMSELTSILRLQQAGCVVINSHAITAMMQRDWRKDTAQGTLDIWQNALPFYSLLANNQNYTKSLNKIV